MLTMLGNNYAQARNDLPHLSIVRRAVSAKLQTYGLPKLGKLQKDYLAQQFFNAGVDLSQEEIFTLGEFSESVIDYAIERSTEVRNEAETSSNLRDFSLMLFYNNMTRGRTDIADTMLAKGVDLTQVDLQALLFDVLRLGITKNQNYSAEWRDWLLAHGADINEPSLNLEIYVMAVMFNNTEFLDWLFANSETTISQLNRLLSLAVLKESEPSRHWLLDHGANVDSLEPELVKQTTMLVRLLEKKPLKFWDEGVVVSSDTLNTVLQAAAELSTKSWGRENYKYYIVAMDELLELGASVDALDLQKLLYDSLKVVMPNQGLAEWAVMHGANINALDLNMLIKKSISKRILAAQFADSEKVIDSESFFVLLRKLGLDNKQLDLPQLLIEAEEADRELLQAANREGIEDAPTTGFVEQLRLLQQE